MTTLVVGIGAGVALTLPRRRRRARPPALRWKVRVENATTVNVDYWEATTFEGRRPVEGVIAVKLVRGAQRLPVGKVAVAGANFGDELSRLRVEAEDRCAALNAALDDYGE